MVSAKSVTLFGSMLLGNVMGADNMGPAAFLWPPDREWSADADNTAPCGSTNGPGVRTEFPLVNGKLALVTQDITRSVHLSVSYENDPKSASDFETFLGPSEVGSLDLGHTCVTVPTAPSGTAAGSNATYRMLYVSNFDQDESKRETYYACADVTFVEVFAASIPCFNATVSDPDVDVDTTVNVTTTDSGGNTPHTAADFTAAGESKSSGLSKGAIAGAAVGSIAGVSLLALAGFFFWRKKAAKKEAVTEPMQQRWDAEKAVSDTSSVNSRPQH
ncbi:WSC2 [Colletotrichum scovillei]|uniref:WSC2 protein n=1 Tax=Colletotrichum scovillei TaxID=1209932 RepID=A0A9P7RAU7_9PEZI|nr:WSC2 [Colletotrichum scovillei]KAF4775642.1 WSC2 [Colletotrichum scovillei]KAG7052074.1 WSC2 protein [Colletotrichum scovillei]KAG7071107.1 WSC2 protein [Colletotrichum scovillei]KAG7079318.1 WSC2 protein [Colletotrichum scovillei]